MTRVLILDTSIDPAAYRPTQHWRALLADTPSDSVHLPSSAGAPDLAPYSHLILSGSEASIVCPEPWFAVEEALLRAAVDAGIPILGSCFGHQMLARALSGPASVRRAANPELGWVAVEILAPASRPPDPLLDGLWPRFHTYVAHFDEVCAPPPPPWRVLARSAGCGVQVMRCGERPIWGLQCHPEIPIADGRALLEHVLRQRPELDSLIRPVLAGEPCDDQIGRALIARFLAVC
jgi:GMP synthase-like glutamine amidotransferase